MRRFARQLKHIRLRRDGTRAQRPAAGPAGDDPPQRGQRRHAVPPGLAGPPPRAAAPGAADRRQPLDGAVQLLLPAAGARAQRRAGRRPQLHLPHPRHRGVAGAARPRSLARAGAAASDRAGLGRRHAHRREPGAVQSRARAAPRAFAHRRHRDERRLRHRRSAAAVGCAGAVAAPRAAHRLAQSVVQSARLRADQPGHAGGAAAPGPAGAGRRPGEHSRRAAQFDRRT